ncbi:MAG: Secretion system C-terminal sorting domain [Bacteroidetes bacterium]|jgi:hypothetical protein|nr:Secretion system C-terminal sorting domain [Bacteroidota bacterium]
MKRYLPNIIFALYFCSQTSVGQITDYRDAFLGLYHSTNTNGWNSAIQSPFPNVYIYVEKSLTSSDSIIITDTMQSVAPYKRYAKLNADSSWISFSGYYGHFKKTDSVHCNSVFPGPSWAFYDGRKIGPVGIWKEREQTHEWYLFPNPATHEFTILFPDQNEEITLSLLDIHGRGWVHKNFKTQIHMDVSTLPRGLYIVRLTGENLNLTRRLVLTE